MKKIILSLICLSGFCMTSSVMAEPKIGIAIDQGFGVTGQFKNVNAFIGNDGLSGDYIFKQGSFSKDIPFHWYVAGGAYYNWAGSNNLGVRVPLGLTFPFAKRWDIYGQLAPDLDYNTDDKDIKFGLDFALGIRYAF